MIALLFVGCAAPPPLRFEGAVCEWDGLIRSDGTDDLDQGVLAAIDGVVEIRVQMVNNRKGGLV